MFGSGFKAWSLELLRFRAPGNVGGLKTCYRALRYHYRITENRGP